MLHTKTRVMDKSAKTQDTKPMVGKGGKAGDGAQPPTKPLFKHPNTYDEHRTKLKTKKATEQKGISCAIM